MLGQTQFSVRRVGAHGERGRADGVERACPGRVTLSDEAWADVGDAAEAAPREAKVKGLGTVTVWDVTRVK